MSFAPAATPSPARYDHSLITRPASPRTENSEILRHPSLEREPTPLPRTDKGKEKEVITVEVNNPLSNLVFKPRPQPIPKKVPASIDSATSGSTSAEPTIITPPSNDPSDTSLAVKMELLVAKPPELIPSTVNSKAQPAKEPGSVFATYWNGLLKTDKEVYKHKAALQVRGIHDSCAYLHTNNDLLYSSARLDPPKGTVLVMTQMRSSGWIRGGMAGAGWRRRARAQRYHEHLTMVIPIDTSFNGIRYLFIPPKWNIFST
ncbi:hypothetical protein F4604DRAFT_1908225, partial [Suillus subluteus]